MTVKTNGIENVQAFGYYDGFPIDLEYFSKLQNEDQTREALAFMLNGANLQRLLHQHTPDFVNQMWRAVFRACIAHSVAIPESLRGHAALLGVVLPA